MTAMNNDLHDQYCEYLKNRVAIGTSAKDILDYPHWLEAVDEAVKNQLIEIEHPREHNMAQIETSLFISPIGRQKDVVGTH